MTTYNRATLKTFFENGDVPQGSDYANLIDSCLNVVETAVQTLNGAINPTELITARVSAGVGVFTSNLTVGGTLNVTQNVITPLDLIGRNLYITNINASAVSAHTLAGNSISASAAAFTAITNPVILISALGSTQATAAPLTATINRVTGVVDGQTTGVLLNANLTGQIQYVFNQTAVSANLWPCLGGQINTLASNAAFAMAGNTLYTIAHIQASAYAVK